MSLLRRLIIYFLKSIMELLLTMDKQKGERRPGLARGNSMQRIFQLFLTVLLLIGFVFPVFAGTKTGEAIAPTPAVRTEKMEQKAKKKKKEDLKEKMKAVREARQEKKKGMKAAQESRQQIKEEKEKAKEKKTLVGQKEQAKGVKDEKTEKVPEVKAGHEDSKKGAAATKADGKKISSKTPVILDKAAGGPTSGDDEKMDEHEETND
jgi:hypothetical protein